MACARLEPNRRLGSQASCSSLGGDEDAVCPVTGFKLGSMGRPVAVQVEGQTVSVCCEACVPRLRAAPAQFLVRLGPPPKGSVLTIPESAVIDCGNRTLVYVEVMAGVFEGRRRHAGTPLWRRLPGDRRARRRREGGGRRRVSDRRRKPDQPGDTGPRRSLTGTACPRSG